MTGYEHVDHISDFSDTHNGVLLITSGIGAHGISIIAGSVVYFMQLFWNPQVCTLIVSFKKLQAQS